MNWNPFEIFLSASHEARQEMGDAEPGRSVGIPLFEEDIEAKPLLFEDEEPEQSPKVRDRDA